MNFTISQDKRDKMVVFGDGSAYVELPIIEGVRVYTGVCGCQHYELKYR